MHKVLQIAAGVLAATCLCGFAACSSSEESGTNWSNMIYSDYDTLYAEETAPEGTEGYWDYWETKPVSYQFTSDHSNPKATDDHSFAAYFSLLLNLYEDGSVKGWQRTFLIGSMFYAKEDEDPERAAYNEQYKLLYLYYGYWEKDGTNITLYIQNSVDYASDGENIQYKKYEFSIEPNADDGLASFYFNQSENGVAIRSYISCHFDYEDTVRYTSFASFASGEIDGKQISG